MTQDHNALVALSKAYEKDCFMGSIFQNCECETICWQTLHACANNLRDTGTAFSYLAPNCEIGRQACGTNNAAGLERVVGGGYLEVGEFGGKKALFPTPKFINLMRDHLKKGAK